MKAPRRLTWIVAASTAGLVLLACSKSSKSPAGETPNESTGGSSGETMIDPPDSTGGAIGATGGSGGVGGASGGSGPVPDWPDLLSETGLYSDIVAGTLQDGVVSFEPRYELWSDNATKNRWISLPPGSQIDTTDMNNWVFPVGTKTWKEFSRDGKRIETRMMTRTREGGRGWVGVAYVWNEDQTDAIAMPDGVENASGTDHDVPATSACLECHGESADWPLGFSAVQLAHEGPGATLRSWGDTGRLTEPATTPLPLPGSELEQDFFGYLHANCGGCHRQGSTGDIRTNLRLWLNVEAMGTVEDTDIYRFLVNQQTNSGDSIHQYRVEGSAPERSELIRRMELRGLGQMPPLGTELVDNAAVDLAEQWVNLLAAPAGGSTP